MKLLFAAVAFAFLAQPALAQDKKGPSEAQKAQQQRMKDCNAKAKGMKGDERKDFMKGCLSGKEGAEKMTSQQSRMKDCNAKAKGMKGDERKKFMSSCLKG
ncbi:MAG TPA: PsiF family protein [Burkholderiales bacterium]|nr:PsiF family protein [Burkholderiales bacterium]